MLGLLLTGLVLGAPVASPWRPLGDGVDYATFVLDDKPSAGDGLLHAVRIDPARARIVAGLASLKGGGGRTAGQWAEDEHLVVAINAGMFAQEDMSTHTGYLRFGEHTNSKAFHPKYKSVLAISPGLARWGDCDGGECPRFETADLVVQNLRLIGARKSQWQDNGRAWSEAAIAIDDGGRVLFLFSRTPLTMAVWNTRILALPLNVVGAMHAEGGPEASLSIRAPGLSLDLMGSYETGFHERDDVRAQWPIPNVLGVKR